MAIPSVEMDMQSLLQFVFIENKKANIIFQSEMFKTSKDLFFFCVDFLCKGLVLLFSEDGKTLYFSKLSTESFMLALAKMEKLGINASITDASGQPGNEPATIVSGQGSRLEEFCLFLPLVHVRWYLQFSLARVA